MKLTEEEMLVLMKSLKESLARKLERDKSEEKKTDPTHLSANG